MLGPSSQPLLQSAKSTKNISQVPKKRLFSCWRWRNRKVDFFVLPKVLNSHEASIFFSWEFGWERVNWKSITQQYTMLVVSNLNRRLKLTESFFFYYRDGFHLKDCPLSPIDDADLLGEILLVESNFRRLQKPLYKKKKQKCRNAINILHLWWWLTLKCKQIILAHMKVNTLSFLIYLC